MRRALLVVALACAACGATKRDVAASLDPSNPQGPEGVVPPPPVSFAEQKPPPTNAGAPTENETMPGMQHDMPGMPGMQHDMGMEQQMPGMQHDMPGMPGMPGMQHDMGMQHEMPGMQHGKGPAKQPPPSTSSHDEHQGMPAMPGMGNAGDETKPKAKAKAIYRCPMHPEVVSDKPGRCPKCGMQLQLQKDGGSP